MAVRYSPEVTLRLDADNAEEGEARSAGATRRSLRRADLGDPNRLLSRNGWSPTASAAMRPGRSRGVITRRYHGVLIAALAAPLGRLVMLSQMGERVRLPGGRVHWLSGEEKKGGSLYVEGANRLSEFRLEAGLPVWIFEIDGYTLEKRLLLPRFQNTALITYTLLRAPGPMRLDCGRCSTHGRTKRPWITRCPTAPSLVAREQQIEVRFTPEIPPLRLQLLVTAGAFTVDAMTIEHLHYRLEHSRGYEASGDAWSPGYFRVDLVAGQASPSRVHRKPGDDDGAVAVGCASGGARATAAAAAVRRSGAGRSRDGASSCSRPISSSLRRPGRVEDAASARASGDEARTVIAGYHWFTDWGRDTMISLEGLTLTTGRVNEARDILRTFAYYFRDGLIPNLFPEGNKEGLYNTADATLWFFHALNRYLEVSGDWPTIAAAAAEARRLRRASRRRHALQHRRRSGRRAAAARRARPSRSPGWTRRWTTGS